MTSLQLYFTTLLDVVNQLSFLLQGAKVPYLHNTFGCGLQSSRLFVQSNLAAHEARACRGSGVMHPGNLGAIYRYNMQGYGCM